MTDETNSVNPLPPKLQENVNLEGYNTLSVPARARYFARVDSPEALPELIRFARERQLPLLPLGGGSNLVLKTHFPGLVVHIDLKGRELVRQDRDHFWLKVAAGENWHQLVQYTLAQGYWGLENLSLIPGRVGAAPIQNIGAYGVELKDRFEQLEAMDLVTGERRVFNKDDCGFGYRDSVFKRELKDRYLILSVTFKLHTHPHLKISYPTLKDQLRDLPPGDITPERVSEAVCGIRRSKLPDPAEIPNVGSFFKNPVVGLSQFLELQVLHPGLVSYPVDPTHVKLAAGWLIERAGWKGVKRGSVAVHTEQALVLTNPGHGMGSEVLSLADDIRESIASEYGIDLEAEPRVYP